MRFMEKVYYKLHIGEILSLIDRIFWKPYHVMNAKETIDYIISSKCSVARFGDGEFNIAAYGCGIGFQKADEELQKRLNKVIASKESNLLLCLPTWAGWKDLLKKEKIEKLGPVHQHGIEHCIHDWMKNFSRKQIYGDANISRIVDLDNFASRKAQIDYTKKIWENRHIVLIEGEKTRFGVGNDLLDNSISVSRILGPAESAFEFIGELVEACECECKKLDNPVVLLALGPTATVMALDLQKKGIQAIDIGHLDIIYEVCLHNIEEGMDGQTIPVPRKYAVPGKYTNEAIDGAIVGECEDLLYLSQIKYKYKNSGDNVKKNN